MRRERVREQFEREVIGDAPTELDAAVNELIDWLLEQEHRLWQGVNDYITRRRQGSASVLGTPGAGGDEHVIGAVGATFDFNRRAVLQRVAQAANRTVASYDREVESRELATTLQGAVAQTAVAGAGAIGLGVGLAIAVGTAAADFTGITLGLVLAGLGLAVLPYHRNRAKAQFDAKTRELEAKLTCTLREQFEREVAAGKAKLTEALAPYTRFVRIESERVAQVRESLARIEDETAELRRQIEGATSAGDARLGRVEQPVA